MLEREPTTRSFSALKGSVLSNISGFAATALSQLRVCVPSNISGLRFLSFALPTDGLHRISGFLLHSRHTAGSFHFSLTVLVVRYRSLRNT